LVLRGIKELKDKFLINNGAKIYFLDKEPPIFIGEHPFYCGSNEELINEIKPVIKVPMSSL
jgi:hypothetical protein